MIYNLVKYFIQNQLPFVRYKTSKFLTYHLNNFLALNLLFLYLINKVELGQDILQVVCHRIMYMCDFFKKN